MLGPYQTCFGWFANLLVLWSVCFAAAAHFLPGRGKMGLLLYGFVSWALPEALVPDGCARGEPLPAWWYLAVGTTLAVGAVAVCLLL